MKRTFAISLLFLSLFTLKGQQIVINEVMTSNKSTLSDEDGDHEDWIELYNAGSTIVNLQGWGLSDDTAEIKWTFPSITIQPGEFMLIFASDKGRKDDPLHTNFKLSSGNEPAVLFNRTGEIADNIPAQCIPTDNSYGRIPDGNSVHAHFSTPSPGYSNNANDTITIKLQPDSVTFSHKGGFYTGPFNLQLEKSLSESTIFYTTDGDQPEEDDKIYLSPLLIKNISEKDNKLSDIPTAPSWQEPEGKVFKANVIRAVAYQQGCPVSPVMTNTYFVDENVTSRYTMPVISISTDEDNFFDDEEGFYVIGEKGQEDIGEANFYKRGDKWERPVFIEYYDENGKKAFEQQMDAKIHGGGSRREPQKSLRIYAKDKYGSPWIKYPLFSGISTDSFKRLILGTTMGDHSYTLFTDELTHSLIEPLNVDHQESRPVIVFLNGEYWGIHNLMERQDEYYVHSHYGIDPDSVNLVEFFKGNVEVDEGNAEDYKAMISYIEQNDLKKDVHYKYVSRQMDINNFINYNIAQLYFSNTDWPDNNVAIWKSQSENSKWRWLFFDCDFCLRDNFDETLLKFINGNVEEDEKKDHFLLTQLLKNDNFRETFIRRFYSYTNKYFTPESIISVIDSFSSVYAPMIPEHIDRWHIPGSYAKWQDNVEDLKNFAVTRPTYVAEQLVKAFGQPVVLAPNPADEQVFILLPEDTLRQVSIFNYQGRLIKQQQLSGNSEPLNIENLSPGIYVLQVRYGRYMFSEKLGVF